MKQISAAIVCVGLAGVAAWAEMNGHSYPLLWIGAAFAFFCV